MSTPATVVLSESNGAGEVVTHNIANINFGTIDAPNLIPANHPVVKPTFGSHFSFPKWLRVEVVNMGDSSLIDELRIWKSAGALLPGEFIAANTSNGTFTFYSVYNYFTPVADDAFPGAHGGFDNSYHTL